MTVPVFTGPIVVGFVSTPEGHAALRYAGREALLRKLPLVVVDLSREGHDVTPTSIEPDLAGVRVECDAANLSVDIAPAESFLEPSEHVLKVAQEVDATLIVVGQRHRSRVGKFLLGSSVQRIVLEADCPVVTVKSTLDAHA